ncbi:RNA-guided endonuclease IscB [Streptomyces sp. AC550_RSS872]|uniref:RNA-guided endonuclease IscB n=1 Tax=Streptomyces sp. AC550_RSS872 TaxID=2823689 RepID=UPI001C2810B6|nr:RNA-guided endonuclease IscB [Streptomyces sp. AC550_RSS872]
MTTFNSREKTHRAVLPQRRALESAGADTPGSRDETACGLPAAVSGTGSEHGRGEILPEGIPLTGRHPNSASAGKGEVREGHPMVFVLDKHHQPLMPCTPARARKLLKQGRAVVHRHTPFVIRLKDRTAATSEVTGVKLGIDPGSRFTGIALFRTDVDANETARHGLFAIELAHRGGPISDRLTSRSTLRRARRQRNLRYRAPRFNNRSRPEAWLAPSLRHRVETTTAWVDRIARWAPLRTVHIELAAFDTRALSADKSGSDTEYRRGTLQGMEVREYLLMKWNRACAYCGASDIPLNIDHIHPRSRGGSDRISNLTIACVPCNERKSNRPVEDFLKKKPTLLSKIFHQAKAPLRDAAAMNATRCALVRALEARYQDVRPSSGGRTRWNRQRTATPKSHTLDALCVGVLEAVARHPAIIHVVAATGRGTYRRTTPDRYGFPRLSLPRTKQHFGYATGDLVRANVPTGKRQGSHTGRVAVRATGNFNIKTIHGLVQGIHHRHVHLLQRADGYAYTTRAEAVRA